MPLSAEQAEQGETVEFVGASKAHCPRPRRPSCDSPGPASYATEGLNSVGCKTQDSRKESSPSFGFGTSTREAFLKTFTGHRADVAGGRPNFTTARVEYSPQDCAAGAGGGQGSASARAPAFTMAKSTRDSISKTFLPGQEHKKPNFVTADVATYTAHRPATARQRSDSTHPNTPGFGFGASTRDDWYKTYTDKGTSRAGSRPSTLTARARYVMPAASIGKPSPDSRHTSSPGFRFGNGQRSGAGRTCAAGTVPFQQQGSTMGNHATVRGDSTKARAPSCSFGSARRDAFDKMAAKVRPGQRPSKVTASATVLDPMSRSGRGMGPQVESHKRTQRACGFGTSTREHAAQLVTKPHF